MKMADGGFRPANNEQFASDSGAVAGVAIDSNGSDMGKMVPMNEALAENYGERPRQHLADGGYAKFDDLRLWKKPASKSTHPSRRRATRTAIVTPRGPTMRQPSPLGGSAWAPKRQKTSTRSGRRRLNARTRKREIVACGSFSCAASARSNRSRSCMA
jgi:hypothetical protein